MVKTKRTFLALLFGLTICLSVVGFFLVSGAKTASAIREREYEIGSIYCNPDSADIEYKTYDKVQGTNYSLGKAYASTPTATFQNFNSYYFSYERFKTMSFDGTAESAGTYLNPGSAEPFAIMYGGGEYHTTAVLNFSIGNDNGWAVQVNFNRYTCQAEQYYVNGTLTSTTAEIAADMGDLWTEDTDRRVLRIFVDYATSRIWFWRGGTDYMPAPLQADFSHFDGEINMFRFLVFNDLTEIYTEQIMGDNNLDCEITFNGDLPETVEYNQTVIFPSATISYLTEDKNATVSLKKPNGSTVTSNFKFDQYGVYNLRYSYTTDGKIYYKEYQYIINDPTPIDIAEDKITLSANMPTQAEFGSKCILPSAMLKISGVNKDATTKITYPSGNVVERQVFRAVELGDYTVSYFVFDGATGKTYKKDYTITVVEPQASELQVAENPLFVGVEPNYCEYPYENGNSDFGYGYLGTILGSYGSYGFSFDLEDFKNLTFDESKSTGTLTDPKQTPFVVIYSVPSAANAYDATGMAIRLGNADTHIYSNWMNTSDLNLCLLRETDGKAVIDGGGGTGIVERESGNIEVPQKQVAGFNYRAAGDVAWSVLRVYVDYERGYIYFANGSDQTVENMVKHPCNFKAFDKNELNRFDLCPWGVSEENGVSFMFAEMFGKQPNDAFITMYGKFKSVYKVNSEEAFPRAEIQAQGEYFTCVVDVINSDGEVVADSVNTFSFPSAGEYTLRYHYTVGGTDYYREYNVSAEAITEIEVVVPTPAKMTIKVGEELPALTGSTSGGAYRWKAGQTVKEGENEYEWEFVPSGSSDNVEYTNISGKIRITATAADNNGCGCGSSMSTVDIILPLVIALAVVIAVKTKKRKS